MFGDHEGGLIHWLSGRKKDCVKIRQPISTALMRLASDRLYCSIRVRISPRLPAPFAVPKASHASCIGMTLAKAKMPPPTIMLIGACSLNRNSSPGCKARNDFGDGDQKLISVSAGC